MKRNSPKNLLVIVLILALAASFSPPSVSAEPQKVVFTRPSGPPGYNPPPVGHFNFFVAGVLPIGPPTVLEPLTHYWPANGTYLPGLAINWTYKDYEVFTLKLRRGGQVARWNRVYGVGCLGDVVQRCLSPQATSVGLP